MTHLANFRAMPPRRDGARRVNLKWRSITGSFLLAGPEVSIFGSGAIHGDLHGGAWRCYYRRYSKLGELLFANAEQERHVIRRELHDANVVPAGRAVEFIGLRN